MAGKILKQCKSLYPTKYEHTKGDTQVYLMLSESLQRLTLLKPPLVHSFLARNVNFFHHLHQLFKEVDICNWTNTNTYQ